MRTPGKNPRASAAEAGESLLSISPENDERGVPWESTGALIRDVWMVSARKASRGAEIPSRGTAQLSVCAFMPSSNDSAPMSRMVKNVFFTIQTPVVPQLFHYHRSGRLSGLSFVRRAYSSGYCHGFSPCFPVDRRHFSGSGTSQRMQMYKIVVNFASHSFRNHKNLHLSGENVCPDFLMENSKILF